MVGLVLEEFLPYRIVVLGDRLSRRLARAYADEGISIPEWRVLAVISQEPRMAARDVAARTPMDKMAVSRAVAALEDKGLVTRSEDDDDRRVLVLALSREGREVFNRIARRAIAFERRLLERLNKDERRCFRAALDRLDEIDEEAEAAPA